MKKNYEADEAFWLESIRKGDELAFECLFKQNYERLTRFASSYTSSKAIAEEIVQDVYAEIWEKRENLNVSVSLRAYLYMKIKNRCLNHLKHQRVKETYDPQWVEHIMVTTQPDEQLAVNKLKIAIQKAVEQLPPKSKATFKLHRFDGLTYNEIAEVMDVSQKTVESQMTRTLKMLRKHLSHLLSFFFILPW